MAFNFNGEGFNFSASSKGKRKTKQPTTDYQQRNKQEYDRRKLATCIAYTTEVCFNSEVELKHFQKLLGAEKQFYPCCEIEDIIASFPVSKRDWKTKITTDIQKIDFWEEKKTFEQTCKNDLKECLKLLKQADSLTEVKNIYNSPYFVVLVAKDDDDLTDFLTRHKLFRYGERRLDGSKWLKDIKQN